MQQPTVGRIVHYQLSSYDAEDINRRRADFSALNRSGVASSAASGEFGRSGHVGHFGNEVTAGDVCAAVIVRVWSDVGANLQVLLDGNDTFWATSRGEGDEPGHWSWPPRA